MDENIRTITEPAHELPVAAEADVIVVGGGLAGVAAAVAARRSGAEKVILIEKSIILGGLATLGHVCVYLPIDDGLGHKIYGGLAEELLHICIRYSYDNLPECWHSNPAPDTVENPTGRYQSAFNIPAGVMSLDEYCADEGVEVIFDTNFCAPIMDGDTCKGIIVENKSGRSAYLAKMFIDASGDSDLLARAGAPCECLKNIVSHWAHEFDLADIKQKLEEGKEVTPMNALPLRWLGLRPDTDNSDTEIPMYYGHTVEGVNGYIKTSRKLALDFLKKNQRDDYAQFSLPMMPQFRMTRRLVGKAEMTAMEPGVSLETSIGCAIYSIENPAEVYEFPYEGLIDAKITNIAAAGRMVSASGRGWEVMRFIPACVLTGQAAGTAAALAIKNGQDLQTLSVSELQDVLAADGVKIHMADEVRATRHILSHTKAKSGGDMIKNDSLAYDDEKETLH